MESNWILKKVKPGYENRLNIYFSSKKEKELALEFVEEAKIEEVLP